jgi:H+/gluconate symporter-like permease
VMTKFSNLKVDIAYKYHTLCTLVQVLVGIATVYVLKLVLI